MTWLLVLVVYTVPLQGIPEKVPAAEIMGFSSFELCSKARTGAVNAIHKNNGSLITAICESDTEKALHWTRLFMQIDPNAAPVVPKEDET